MASGLDQWLGKLEGHNEIGEALTKQLQSAEDEVQQFVGGQAALKLAAEKVGNLGAIVSEDLESGKLNFDSELKASEYIKRMVIRAREVILNLSEGAKAKEVASAGKVSALKESREVVMRHTLVAKARAEQLQAAAEEALTVISDTALPSEFPKKSRRSRASGEHPGPSSLASRRDEAARERASTQSPEKSAKKPVAKKNGGKSAGRTSTSKG